METSQNADKSILAELMFLLINVLVLAVCFLGCAGSLSSAPKEPLLDEALRQSAERIEERLDAGTRVALINVRSPSDQFSEYVLTYLESIFVNNGKLVVVDRSNLDRIRQELGFQLSGEVSDESAKTIGKMLGAGAIITGTLINIGDTYRLTLKAINVETATVAASYPADIANDTRVKALLASRNTATATASASAGRQTPATTQSTVSQAPAYKIGDTGPAGGLIFYDKGNSAGGWRYLEAAPASTEVKVIWSQELIWPNQINASDSVFDQRALGLGKTNTQKIMNILNNRGGGFGTAARACDDFVVNGFDDWFLPSSDELNWMYGNLHRRGLGEFKSEQYWSSTQHSFYAAYVVNFSNGNQTYGEMKNAQNVRAIRQF